MRLYCDFDGTISSVDTTDWILSRFAAPAWEDIEAEWLAGRMTAAACMQAQIALIHASDDDLNDALDAVEIDPGFTDFAAWAAREALPLTVVSDGVDYFIERILTNHGLGHLPVIANRFRGDARHRFLLQPYSATGCASGVCKCAAVGAHGAGAAGPLVFVGDGRSDFCVSGQMDILFAKGKLADYARARDIAHIAFDTFHDVTLALSKRIARPRPARVLTA
jgi:2,3-diketo-5-methylthio-1-phosphopentane phosphatase